MAIGMERAIVFDLGALDTSVHSHVDIVVDRRSVPEILR